MMELAFSIVVICVAIVHQTKCDCPAIISRQTWNASEALEMLPLRENPPPYLMIHHSAQHACDTVEECKKSVNKIQNLHMLEYKWEDIGYNFLIGGDGSIFEGKGWDIFGSHCVGYNQRSIGICLIGNYQDAYPPEKQLQALKDLIKCCVENKKTTQDYHLVGHRQGFNTLCPGDKLFKIIEDWPHFDPNPE